jgi:hypothetical protein
MNIETTSNFPSALQIVTRYLILALSASVIAVAAYVAINGFDNESGPQAQSSALPAGPVDPARLDSFASRPTGTFLIVNSEEQRAQVSAEQQQIADERKAAGGRQHLFAVVLADSTSTEDDAWHWYRDLKSQWLHAGATEVRFVDLRAQ